MIVKNGETQRLTFKRKNIVGFSFKAQIQHTTDNTAFAALGIDWSKINVKAVLKRGGRTYNIFQDVALPLLAASAFRNGTIKQIVPLGTPDLIVYRAHGASTKAIVIHNGTIDLGDIINLAGDDELELEVTSIAGAYASTADTSASYIEFDEIEGVGNEFAIPVIGTKAVRANESRLVESLGDLIKTVFFVNLDKSGVTLANNVIQSVIFTCDKFTYSDNYLEILAKRYRQFETVSAADNRDQSFCLATNEKGVPLNGCQVDMQLTPTNVTSGKNYLVFWGYVSNREAFERAVDRDARHKSQNIQALVSGH